ncbi:MAG: aminotransferase class V-fold PLP-dependent enzyme, partial [Ruthenibacterium sp.]
VLYMRRGVLPYNFMDGGGQENHRRAGTENIAGIVGLGAALAHANETLREKAEHQAALRDYVITRVLKNIPQTHLNGDAVRRLPGNANISFAGLEGETILMDLDMHGVCASTGSACNSDSLDPSHVLLAIGLPHEAAHGTMRFSFGPQNTMEEA